MDLGSAKTVNHVSLFPKNSYGAITGGAPCFPKDFTISVSADGTNYRTVVTETDYENPGIHQQIFDFDEVEARYVKLTITKLGEPDYTLAESARYRVQLAEIEVAHVTTPVEEPDDPSDTPDDPDEKPEDNRVDHSECEGNFFSKIWTAILNFFRKIFMLPTKCVCGEEI